MRLSGYEFIRSSTNGACSKIIVFVRRELTYVLQPIPPHDDNQYICITVKKNKLLFTLIGVYISPSSNFETKRLADILSVCPAPWVIIGDFNAHHPAWGSTRTNAKGRRLASIAYNYDLTLLNDGSPTFLRGVTYGSCLDLAFVSNSLAKCVKWFPDIETHGSDHIPTYLNIKGLSSRSGPRKTIRTIQWATFKSDMEDACREGLPSGLEQTIKSTMQNATRMMTISSKRNDFDIELERLRALRRRAERRYRRTKSIHDLRAARRMQKKIQRRMDRLASERWATFCQTLDPRKPLSHIWKTVQGLRCLPEQRFPFKALALFQGRQDIDVAEDFCAMIADQATRPDPPARGDVPHSRDCRMDLPFTMEELEAALALCRRSSSPGPDGISYRALCYLGESARRELLSLYNSSWQEGNVPDEWKVSRLVPLLKQGKSQLELTSYRPIALASCVGKVMERMLLGRLEWYLEHYKIYPNSMAGFRRDRSSIDNVVDLVSYVQHERSRKRLSAALFLDVKGAYDNVLHESILDALATVGLGGRVFLWIASYLSARSFFVLTDDGPTTRRYTIRGVPQGGALSPTLFNLALLGLAEYLPTTIKISIYADDICVWTSAVTRPQIRARLQRAATLTASYLCKQGLSISPEKCALVAFTRKPMTPYVISISGQTIS